MMNFYNILRIQIKELKGLQDTFKVHDSYIQEKMILEGKLKELQLKLSRLMAGKIGIRNYLKGVPKGDLIEIT